ncbi:hypothetical protein A3E46_01225 [Candidatus Woesebacteria bacterium RIFCSPHIGHO2_12_FULL_46_16]|uniref:Glycosyltransferase RgtA/B/C/D-like domain-containing protein n=1 Tax=Candidatus Woesebacteria bacterium RIFCSPHIGHO2_12_FULL_46_16 TaxID=1802513 RepID=A0A1F8B0H9_9BACT|nr:MAG: hypothetical protein A3E46_01225 [Candidatus Woesebacteria bacterium RIFCSPHIGHO2_12_FULL_46_16]
MKRSEKIIVFLIILAAFILRAYKIADNFVFSGEFGTELLYVRDALASNRLLLIGLPTSHNWISYGPLYYWLMMPLMKALGPEPLMGAWVGIVAGTLAVAFNYLFVRKIFNEKVALVSSVLIAISPIWIWFSRMARLYIFNWLIWYPFVYFLWQLWRGKAKNIFWLGFFFGLFFNFHFSPILILPVLFLVFVLKRRFLKLKHYSLVFLGAILANLPSVIYDAQQGFSMLKSFAVWIPYRIAGFVGLYPKNNPTAESFSGSLNIINEFFGKMFVLNEPLWIVSTIVFFVLAGILLKQSYKKVFKDFGIFLIFLSLASVLAGVFIHGAPPIHYFLPLFTIPPIVIGMLADKYKSGLWTVVFLLLILFNLKAFFGHYIFYGKVKDATLTPDFVPYKLQKEIARYIISDAKGEKFTLRRVGPWDYFSEEYSQNYRYLLWNLGNEPINGASLSYTIYDDILRLPQGTKDIKWLNNVAVVKKVQK